MLVSATTLAPAEVWLVDLDAAASALHALDSALGLVPGGFSSPVGGSDTAGLIAERRHLSRAVLRALLVAHIGVGRARLPFVLEAGGKPVLDPTQTTDGVPHICFSLAHAEQFALVGLSRWGGIGVDVETVRAVRIRDERRAMLEAAAQDLVPGVALPKGPADARFLQAWVRLEAVAKATGEGVSALLVRLGVRGGQAVDMSGSTRESLARVPVWDIDPGGERPLFMAVAGVFSKPGSKDETEPPGVNLLPVELAALKALMAARGGL